MGNASCNLRGIFSWSYEWKFYNLVAWLMWYHYHVICFIWKNACLGLLKFPLCWICFKNCQYSHCVNVCCVGRDSVSPCEVTELFRVDGSGSGDGDMEVFLPADLRRGKQLFQGPLLSCILTSLFRDNSTNHLSISAICRSFV